MSTAIRISGPSEFDDYLAAHLWASRRQRLTVRVVAVVAGVICLAGSASAVGIGIFLLLWAAFLGDALFRHRVRRMWKRDGAHRDDVRLDFSADGVTSTVDDDRPVFEPWSYFVDWTEGPAVFLLLTSARSWVIVPKRLVATADAERVRDMFHRHVGSGPSGRDAAGPTTVTAETGDDR